MEEIRVCEDCGKNFVAELPQQRYCSKTCRSRAKKKREKEAAAAKPRQKRKSETTLEDDVAVAMKAGLSYGEYMSQKRNGE